MVSRKTQYAVAAVVPSLLFATAAGAQDQDFPVFSNGEASNHPAPNPVTVPTGGLSFEDDGFTWVYEGPQPVFEESEPFKDAGDATNILPTVYERMIDQGGDRVPNSLPSTPEDPYNLHPDPVVSDIDSRSPRWDLANIINVLHAVVFPEDRAATNQEVFPGGEGVPADPRRGRVERKENAGTIPGEVPGEIPMDQVEFAIDILEGNEFENRDRAYEGEFALLNYNGVNMVKTVTQNDEGEWTVEVDQFWMRQRIKGDTMFFDLSNVPPNETWEIHYNIHAMHWGHEDFAPFQVFFQDPDDRGEDQPQIVPFFQMDQTFFPMEEGKKYQFEMSMPPADMYNLTYHWGWRVHPPRIQAIENAGKTVLGQNIVQWERDVFGENPRASQQAKLEAIEQIGDLSPAKRMWEGFRQLRQLGTDASRQEQQEIVAEIEAAFDDWNDRTSLPRGVEKAQADEGEQAYDQTLFYVNNTIYGRVHGVKRMAEQTWFEFQSRGETLKTRLINGDYFPHAYQNVDFGGNRGWENIYQNTIPIGGQGPWFTFGRTQWQPNTVRPAIVPAAERPEDQQVARLLEGNGEGTPRKIEPRETAATPRNNPNATNHDEGASWLRMPPTPDGSSVVRDERGLGLRDVKVNFNHDPSTRLRYYQFDPMHHNVAIFSVH
ncbi:hypothetical protein SAMN05216241_11713 [Limimonas halophila]|uniref:Uncharacterized protein n=1 Tax=Limimonas halophila TaxID=1082479 RepID=A0A1G7UUI9_9PROT|nr:hypothetical protein [Limimonas halophila]SDG51275.1 hypothetical protein SAMN05216241_11713 [Limimonas halophila]